MSCRDRAVLKQAQISMKDNNLPFLASLYNRPYKLPLKLVTLPPVFRYALLSSSFHPNTHKIVFIPKKKKDTNRSLRSDESSCVIGHEVPRSHVTDIEGAKH